MSDTPRTDKAQESSMCVDVLFARKLERELNAANKRVEELELRHKDHEWAIAKKACELCPFLGKGDAEVDWVAQERDDVSAKLRTVLEAARMVSADHGNFGKVLDHTMQLLDDAIGKAEEK